MAAARGEDSVFTDHYTTKSQYRGVQLVRGLQPSGYESTLVVARQAVAHAIAHRTHRLVVFAAPQHLFRCLRDLRKVAGPVFEITVGDYFKYRRHGDFYTPNSSIPQLRGPIRWWLRELPVRLISWISWRLYARLTG